MAPRISSTTSRGRKSSPKRKGQKKSRSATSSAKRRAAAKKAARTRKRRQREEAERKKRRSRRRRRPSRVVYIRPRYHRPAYKLNSYVDPSDNVMHYNIKPVGPRCAGRSENACNADPQCEYGPSGCYDKIGAYFGQEYEGQMNRI